jgi:zinc-ribbon domain
VTSGPPPGGETPRPRPCPHCGAEVPAGATFCPSCGRGVQPKRSWTWPAAIIAFVAGLAIAFVLTSVGGVGASTVTTTTTHTNASKNTSQSANVTVKQPKTTITDTSTTTTTTTTTTPTTVTDTTTATKTTTVTTASST